MAIAGTVAAVGGSVIGGAMQANAAKGAAKTQAQAAQQASDTQLQAARESNALQWAMYQQQLANNQPYQRGGQLAYSAMMGGMGLGPATSNLGSSVAQPGDATTQVVGNQPGTGYSTSVAGVGDINVTNQGATNTEAQNAANQYAGQFNHQFNATDLQNNMDPGYAFRQKMAMKAIENSAAARGLTGSGQNLADIVNYNQEAASQEYMNAYNRYQTQQSNLWNRLASLSGVGQQANAQAGAAAGQAGSAIGTNTMNAANASSQYLTSAANSRAAGSVGAANAWGGVLGSAGNAYGTYAGLNMLGKMGGV